MSIVYKLSVNYKKLSKLKPERVVIIKKILEECLKKGSNSSEKFVIATYVVAGLASWRTR